MVNISWQPLYTSHPLIFPTSYWYRWFLVFHFSDVFCINKQIYVYSFFSYFTQIVAHDKYCSEHCFFHLCIMEFSFFYFMVRHYFIMLMYHNLYNYSLLMGVQLISHSLLSQADMQYKCPFTRVWIYLKDKFLEVEFVSQMVYTFVILMDTALLCTKVVMPIYTFTKLCLRLFHSSHINTLCYQTLDSFPFWYVFFVQCFPLVWIYIFLVGFTIFSYV